MTCLVVGATGFVGQHLVARLIRENCRVKILTRGGRPLPSEWNGRVEVYVGDLRNSQSIRPALKDVSTVFNLGGVLFNQTKMWEVNVNGAGELVHSANACGATRFIHVSSAGVIGQPAIPIANEKTPCFPINFYEISKLKGEQKVLSICQKYKMEVVVLRPTIIFGEGNRGRHDSFLQWVKSVRDGRFLFFGNEFFANYIYVGDFVEALWLAGTRPIPESSVFLVSDSSTLMEFVEAMARALGIETPKRKIPVWMAFLLASVLQAFQGGFGIQVPLTLSRVRALTCRIYYSSEEFKKGFPGYYFVGYQEGLQRTVQWYKSMGHL